MFNLLNFLIEGGPVIWSLALCSIVAVTVLFYKVWQFWGQLKLSNNSADIARQFIEQNQKAEALILVNGSNNPRAKLIAQVLPLLERFATDINTAKSESIRIARSLISQLNTHLRVLEVIAMIAPLLGLLGTVLGMIEAFKAMEAAGSQVNPAILSGGIWQALLTTAVGMAVAIPVSVAHSYLERRAEVEAEKMQDDLEWIFTLQATTHSEQRIAKKVQNAS